MQIVNFKLQIVVLVGFIALLSGCCDNCKSEMEKTRKRYGSPEEINKYSSSGYNSEKWWYWSRGIEFTFSWGSNVNKCCEKSTYEFDPITKPITNEIRAEVEQNKVLIRVEDSGDCITCP